MKEKNITREKFTTTISPKHKRKLSILAAIENCDRNEWIEKQIDVQWVKFKGDDSNVEI